MAKISARGAVKIAQASKTWTDEDGWDHKLRLALRSDGKVLKAHDLRDPRKVRDYGYSPAKAWNRGSYSILQSLPAGDHRTMFAGLAAKNGCALD
jgi:hypothetical protein